MPYVDNKNRFDVFRYDEFINKLLEQSKRKEI